MTQRTGVVNSRGVADDVMVSSPLGSDIVDLLSRSETLTGPCGRFGKSLNRKAGVGGGGWLGDVAPHFYLLC